MKAFLLSIVVLVAISVIAALGLSIVPNSARDSFTVDSNVRL
jgi:hypothetical protein